MKKRCIAVVLCWILIVTFLLPFRKKAYADPFTASEIASTSYAMMQNWGVSFTAGSATASGMNEFMSNQVQDYVNSKGGSIADVFVGQIAVDAAGKLVVGHTMYNSIVGFLDWLNDKYSLSSSDFALTDGQYKGKFLPVTESGVESITGNGIELVFGDIRTSKSFSNFGNYYGLANIYLDGTNVATVTAGGSNYGFKDEYEIKKNTYSVTVYIKVYKAVGETTKPADYGSISRNVASVSGSLTNSLSWSVPENWSMPTVLNPDKEWTGTIGGYSEPDTNLDQLLEDINQAIADNNLAVDGEVIDVPVPPGPVPTWTPVDDVIDGINQTGEILDGIGNDIGNISGHLDDIGDQIDDVTGALEGVQEGIQTQTGVISGAMDQAAQDVVEAIGEQTATLDQTLTETAEGVQDIAEALQPGEIEPKKFDLRGLFPFCIPFDIHNLLQKFNAEPVAPHVQLPFVIESINFSYMIDLDFSAFDPVAAALRTVEFIVFAIGLAWATSKVIKW